jgi:hypothetical protein
MIRPAPLSLLVLGNLLFAALGVSVAALPALGLFVGAGLLLAR